MRYERASHAVFELKYHFVWVPKYRRMVLKDPVARRLKRIFVGIAERYGFRIEEQEVMPDHVHLFVSAPPRFSPAEMVKILKSASWNRLMVEVPGIRKELWGSALWSSGYFVRATGDRVTSDIVRKYIRYQRVHEEGSRQLSFTFSRR